MDTTSTMAIFAKVVETKSFSQAAEHLRMSKSSVSKQVSKLEDRLGARLLNRTTRKLSLTEAGEAYFERISRILEDIDEAERCVTTLHDEPRGTLKVSAPVTFAIRHLSSAVNDFMTRYPEVMVELNLNDRIVDVVEEGFDIAIRSAVLSDSSLIARKVATTKRLVIASPDYWQDHGIPDRPEDLRDHDCLLYTYLQDGPGVWRFKDEAGKAFTVSVNGPMRVNNGDVLLSAACDGLGVVMLPCFIAADELNANRLQAVLRPFTDDEYGIYAVYPHNRHLSAKVRSFVDFLAERFRGDKSWRESDQTVS